MKKQEIAVFQGIQRNTQMAINAIGTVVDKCYDDEFARVMSRQSLEYAKINQEATRQLLSVKADFYRLGFWDEYKQRTSLQYQTLLNTSTGHIAELMIKDNQQNALNMEKVLRHNEEAGQESTALAKQFLACNENSIKSLKEYL